LRIALDGARPDATLVRQTHGKHRHYPLNLDRHRVASSNAGMAVSDEVNMPESAYFSAQPFRDRWVSRWQLASFSVHSAAAAGRPLGRQQAQPFSVKGCGHIADLYLNMPNGPIRLCAEFHPEASTSRCMSPSRRLGILGHGARVKWMVRRAPLRPMRAAELRPAQDSAAEWGVAYSPPIGAMSFFRPRQAKKAFSIAAGEDNEGSRRRIRCGTAEQILERARDYCCRKTEVVPAAMNASAQHGDAGWPCSGLEHLPRPHRRLPWPYRRPGL
jgi:hypothetical protein